MNEKYYTIIIGKNCERIINLSEILGCVSEKKRNSLNWSLLWFYGSVQPSFPYDLMFFEKMVNTSSQGILYSFSDLIEIMSNTSQITELLLIGDENHEVLHRYPDDKKMKKTCFFTIELVDGWYWEVSCLDEAMLQQLKQVLPS